MSRAEKAARLAVFARTAPMVRLLLAVEVSFESIPMMRVLRGKGQMKRDCHSVIDKCSMFMFMFHLFHKSEACPRCINVGINISRLDNTINNISKHIDYCTSGV